MMRSAPVHAQPQAFEHAARCQGSIELAVDRGLAADRLEPGAVEEGLGQRMAGQRLVEPGDGGGGTGERAREHHRVGRLGPSRPSSGAWSNPPCDLPWALHRIPAVISGLISTECTGALPLRVHCGADFAVTAAL